MTTDEFNERFAKTVSIVWTTFIVNTCFRRSNLWCVLVRIFARFA
jgi:hypothetical protein